MFSLCMPNSARAERQSPSSFLRLPFSPVLWCVCSFLSSTPLYSSLLLSPLLSFSLLLSPPLSSSLLLSPPLSSSPTLSSSPPLAYSLLSSFLLSPLLCPPLLLSPLLLSPLSSKHWLKQPGIVTAKHGAIDSHFLFDHLNLSICLIKYNKCYLFHSWQFYNVLNVVLKWQFYLLLTYVLLPSEGFNITVYFM